MAGLLLNPRAMGAANDSHHGGHGFAGSGMGNGRDCTCHTTADAPVMRRRQRRRERQAVRRDVAAVLAGR